MVDSCSSSSNSVHEQLFGTAPRVDYWLLLETPAAFGKKAYEEALLPPAVRIHLDQALASVKNSRVQLIRRPATSSAGPFHFFVVVNHEEVPNLYSFLLPQYEALLDLDLAAILAERQEFWQFERKAPLFLVCTNGRRDPCCARYGQPVYELLRSQENILGADSVWQTSHVGGHRFAPALVCLPHGIFYGRFSVEDAPGLCQEYLRDRLVLPFYRGRSCYSPPVQAAETFLRQKTGEMGLSAYTLSEVTPDAPGTWMFYFSEREKNTSHCVQVRKETAPYEVYQSCKDEQAMVPDYYRLLDYQAHENIKKPLV